MTEYATIRVDCEGPLTTVLLNRSERRRGMTGERVRESRRVLIRCPVR